MELLDRVRYSGTQITPTTYNVTLAEGYNPIPAGVTEVIVKILDTGGQELTATASISGSTLTVNQIYSSSTVGIPAFSGTLDIYSTVSDVMLRRKFKGVGAILCIGQSNHIGWDTSNTHVDVEAAVSAITQMKYKHTLLGGSLDSTFEGTHRIVQPLYWARASSGYTINGGNLFGGAPVVHAANNLYQYEGFNAIRILPGAEDGKGIFGNWRKGDTLYERMREMAASHLNENPDNYLICGWLIGGEHDQMGGRTSAEFQGDHDQMWNDLKADITADTGVDVSGTPYIVNTLNDVMVAQAGDHAGIQAVIRDTPNRIVNSAVIDIAGEPAIDAYHNTIGTSHKIGNELFVPAFRRALANYNITSAVTGSFAAPLDDITLDIIGDVVTPSQPVTGTLGIALAPVVSNLTGDVVEAAPYPLTDALNVDVHLVKGVGQTIATGISLWEDQSGNANDFIQTTLVDQPTENNGAAEFRGSHALANSVYAFNNTAVGYTIILDVTSYAGNTGSVYSDNNLFANSNYLFPNATTSDFHINAALSSQWAANLDMTDGVRRYIAIAVDYAGTNTARLYEGTGTTVSLRDTSGTLSTPSGFAATGMNLGTGLGYYGTCDIHSMVVATGNVLTLSEINDVISEFPA
jgi:hypothetical protein